jgi:hypothetical protein
MTIDNLKLVYFAYLRLISSYGLILCGNSTDRSKVFNTQKKIIRIMAGAKTVSCRRLFWGFNILPLASEYIFCLISFVVENLKKFQRSTDVRNLNTEYEYGLHMTNVNLTKYQEHTIQVSSYSVIFHLQPKA